MIPFWSNDPTILLKNNSIFEIWPSPKMQYEQKLNAMTRLIILLTLLGLLFTMSFKILIAGIVTLAAIFGMYHMKKQKVTKEQKEGFSSAMVSSSVNDNNMLTNPETLEQFLKTDFEKNSKKNPFANVLLTDIGDHPNRKAAPPAFNPDVYEDITHSVKKMVQKLNPEIKNTDKQLFGDLGENFYLDQSNRNFYSTANTRVQSGDSSALGQFLYGGMISAKESGINGALARVQDNIRYTLY